MSRRSGVALTASLAGVGVLALSVVGISPATASPPGSARVTAAAAQGGRVIVVLREQFPQLSVKKQGALRVTATRSSQRAVLSDMVAHGASDVLQLVSVNAVAARLAPDEIARLRTNPAVASIQRDAAVELPKPAPVPAANVNQQICPTDPAHPLLEPEALSLTHVKSQPAAATTPRRSPPAGGSRSASPGSTHWPAIPT